MNKETLRKVYLEKRRTLDPLEKYRRDQILHGLFFEHFTPFPDQHIHIYLSIERFNEPDTFPLINTIKEKFPGAVLVVSRIGEHGSLQHFRFRGSEQLEVNKWGIPEPTGGVEVTDTQIDLVLVPMVSFDLNGNRIGYGKGFYDRFLTKCRPEAKKIGYTLSVPLDNIPYTEDYDVPLDGCICPLGYMDFSTIPGKWKD